MGSSPRTDEGSASEREHMDGQGSRGQTDGLVDDDRFRHTLVHCIGDNGESGDSSARRSTLELGIRDNAMSVTIR